MAKSHHIPRAEVRPWVSLMALAREEEEEREGGGRGEHRGHRQHQDQHQQEHMDRMGPVEEIWLEFDGYRETSLKMFPIEHQDSRPEKQSREGERDLVSRDKVVLEELTRERSSSSLQREEEEIEGRSGFFRLLGIQQEQEEELSPAFMEYLGRSKPQGYLRGSEVGQGYLRSRSEAGQGYSRSGSEEKGKQDSLTPAFHNYLGSVMHRHSNSTTGSEDSRLLFNPLVSLCPLNSDREP